jgi:hypothetical protein
MRYTIPIIAAFSLVLVLFPGCHKENNTPKKGSELEYFTHLEADKDTLLIGESTKIRAIYKGSGISFDWEVTSGNLTGGGPEVQYHVAICDLGLNTITCTAKAEHKSVTHDIQIYVKVQ